MRRALVHVLAIAALVSGGGFVAADGPSHVVVPQQVIPLNFSHVQHLTKAKVNCVFCHVSIKKSTRTEDRNIPGHPECDQCHERLSKHPEKENPPAACVTCHTAYSPVKKDVPMTALFPPAHIRFSHKAHTDKKIACETCHGDFVKKGVALATRRELPTMTTCLGCHNGRQAPFKCGLCHETDTRGLVRTEYPEGRLLPAGIFRNDKHDGAWVTTHAPTARDDRAYCMSCHTERYCQDCHNNVMKPFKFHGNDFVSMHPVFARSRLQNCESCHRDQSFCRGCHLQLGVAQDSARAPQRLKFHPDGWVSGVGGAAARNPNHHAFQAQRNIRPCAACHAETTCTASCHSSVTRGGQGFNPHPPNFAGRCQTMARKNSRVCMKCHAPNDAALTTRCR